MKNTIFGLLAILMILSQTPAALASDDDDGTVHSEPKLDHQCVTVNLSCTCPTPVGKGAFGAIVVKTLNSVCHGSEEFQNFKNDCSALNGGHVCKANISNVRSERDQTRRSDED